MKRAWPYALALAVVVTGCYLALAPLLRSFSPAPARSANRLTQSKNTTTVQKAKGLVFNRGERGTTGYVSRVQTTRHKAKKAKKKSATVTTPQVSAPAPSTNTTGFASNPPSSSNSSTAKSTPKAPPTSTRSASRKNSAVGGTVDQSQGNGFAGPTGDGGVGGGGQTLTPGS